MSLDIGRMVNPRDLEEGDDVYFSCSVEANPPAYKLTWWHNVSLPTGFILGHLFTKCHFDIFIEIRKLRKSKGKRGRGENWLEWGVDER